jgi:hypothetical protein
LDEEVIRFFKLIGLVSQPLFAAVIAIPRSLWLDKKLDSLYDRAQELDRNGQYDEALKYYLEVFEKSRDCAGWGGVRLSFLLGSIVRMNYKPARQALLNMRTMRECEMLAGMSDFNIIQEWHSINRYLEEERTLEFYDELSWQDLDVSDVLHEIKLWFAADFVKAKRYNEYQPSDLARMKHHLELVFSSFKQLQQRLTVEQLQAVRICLVDREVPTFEIAIACGWNDVASEVARMLVESDTSVRTFKALVQAAQHAGRIGWDKELKSRAQSRLSAEEYNRLVGEI